MVKKVKDCIKLKSYEELILHLFMHVFILCLVLTLFFFLIVSKLERENLERELKKNIKSSIESSSIKKNKYQSQLLFKIANLYDLKDEADLIYNNSLLNYSVIVCLLFIICFIIILITMKYYGNRCTNFLSILFENILLFICVGIIEFIFFINIAIKYIPVKPSFIVELINNTI